MFIWRTITQKKFRSTINILLTLSEVFKRCIYNQIAQFFDTLLSKHYCGLRQSHSAQHCLTVLLENGREILEQGFVFGAFNWTFKSFLHKLLIAKLNQYGFHNKAVKIVYDCLTSRKQKTKISDKYKTHGRKFYWEYPKPQCLDNVPLKLFQWFIDNEMKKLFYW